MTYRVSITPYSLGEGTEDTYDTDLNQTDAQFFRTFDCLRRAKNELYKLYTEDFLAHLRYQSVVQSGVHNDDRNP